MSLFDFPGTTDRLFSQMCSWDGNRAIVTGGRGGGFSSTPTLNCRHFSNNIKIRIFRTKTDLVITGYGFITILCE
jgi:hypothetical protein